MPTPATRGRAPQPWGVSISRVRVRVRGKDPRTIRPCIRARPQGTHIHAMDHRPNRRCLSPSSTPVTHPPPATTIPTSSELPGQNRRSRRPGRANAGPRIQLSPGQCTRLSSIVQWLTPPPRAAGRALHRRMTPWCICGRAGFRQRRRRTSSHLHSHRADRLAELALGVPPHYGPSCAPGLLPISQRHRDA